MFYQIKNSFINKNPKTLAQKVKLIPGVMEVM